MLGVSATPRPVDRRHIRTACVQADAVPMSGTPGYRAGALLLYGTAATDGSGVARRTTGLPLLSAAPLTGACEPPSRLTAPARFGVDAAVACGVPLTPAELRELCRGVGGAPAVGLTAAEGAAGLLPRFGGLVAGARLGSWGSADPSDLQQWVVIDQEVIGAPHPPPPQHMRGEVHAVRYVHRGDARESAPAPGLQGQYAEEKRKGKNRKRKEERKCPPGLLQKLQHDRYSSRRPTPSLGGANLSCNTGAPPPSRAPRTPQLQAACGCCVVQA